MYQEVDKHQPETQSQNLKDLKLQTGVRKNIYQQQPASCFPAQESTFNCFFCFFSKLYFNTISLKTSLYFLLSLLKSE